MPTAESPQQPAADLDPPDEDDRALAPLPQLEEQAPEAAAASAAAEEACADAEAKAVLKEAGYNAEAAENPSVSQKREEGPAASPSAGKENECVTPLPAPDSSGNLSTGKRTSDGDKSGWVVCQVVN